MRDRAARSATISGRSEFNSMPPRHEAQPLFPPSARDQAVADSVAEFRRGKVRYPLRPGRLQPSPPVRNRKVLERATEQRVRITVPAGVITEWWRSRNDVRERILAGVRVEPLSEGLAKIAGEALAAVKGATPIDAIVMASAAQRGDVVYTTDVTSAMHTLHWSRRVTGNICTRAMSKT